MKGAIAGVAASVLLGVGDSKLSLGGMVLGAPTVIGLSVSGASLVSELSHDFILAKIKPNASLAEFEAKALAPLLTAAATIASAYVTIGPVSDLSGPRARGPRRWGRNRGRICPLDGNVPDEGQ